MPIQPFNSKVIEFIQDHIDDDPADLMLKASKFPDLPMRDIVTQIESRQKGKSKLPEWYANLEFIFPPKLNLSQASSEITARFKARWVKGSSIIDLTGGSGVDLYYMSSNFPFVSYVETNKELCDIVEHNFEVSKKQVSVINITTEGFLEDTDRHFDVIYLDPSRRDSNVNRVFALEECEPNVVELYDQLLEKGEFIVIKASPMLDIKRALKQLPDTIKVQVVAVDNEVKEVLFYIRRGNESETRIEAWNLSDKKENQLFEFSFSEEKESISEIGRVQKYLYEPNSAIRKAGAFNLIGKQFGLDKLHSNTHLYSSNSFIKAFPGRILKAVDVFKPSKKEIKKRFPNGKVNVVSKNYPLGANDLKKKFRLLDGGDEFLFFCEEYERGKVCIKCQPV